jgi:hypothetical protein
VTVRWILVGRTWLVVIVEDVVFVIVKDIDDDRYTVVTLFAVLPTDYTVACL